MDIAGACILFLLALSSFMSLVGSYYESKDKRRRFMGLSPRKIIVLGGVLALLGTISSAVKSTADGLRIEKLVLSNDTLSHKIDTSVRSNIKLSTVISKLSSLNYELSSLNYDLSKDIQIKSQAALSKADKLANNLTGGNSIAVATIDCILPNPKLLGFFSLSNIGNFPIRNLIIKASDDYRDYSIDKPMTNELNRIKINVMPSGNTLLNDIYEPNLHRVLTLDTLRRRHSYSFYYSADNGDWFQKIILNFKNHKWYSSSYIIKDEKKYSVNNFKNVFHHRIDDIIADTLSKSFYSKFRVKKYQQ